jgi:2-hydroxy-6-oxonona-2,4-dienedioate hydrolase
MGVRDFVDRLDPSNIKWADVDGVKTRYHEAGEGDPLVLIHGGDFGFVDALDTWSLNFAALSHSFHVFALDKFGQGHTDVPKRDEDYTYDAVLRHVLRWLEVANVPNGAHLVGHSRGGLVVASVLFERPNFAKSAVIVDSATLAPDPIDPRHHSKVFYAEVDRRTPNGFATRDALMVEASLNSHSTAHVTDAYIDRYLEIARLEGQQAAVARMRGGVSESVFVPNINRAREAVLAKIDTRGLPVRTLVVWGRNDPSAPLAEVGIPLYKRICATADHAEMHVFNNAGHYTFREQAPGFNDLINHWCRASAS